MKADLHCHTKLSDGTLGIDDIIILAKNENGRQAINDILSEANITGYYYRPRIDIDLLLSLPPNDVMICTACVAYWHYDDIEDITLKLFNHFKNNFYLEIQNHNTEKQINLNKRIRDLSYKYNIPMIAGLDSHYIYPEDAEIRTAALESKGIRYEDEDGWYMDYPSDEECFARFQAQVAHWPLVIQGSSLQPLSCEHFVKRIATKRV